ncbi:hypothetical protein ACIRBZ_00965 [Streptomyces sp. NPDC094038]|uniref:hypothetical protein n=1 Tax=Streptomyces sp. NPDC094038 TaxID=3366055 RepID=UPI0038185939
MSNVVRRTRDGGCVTVLGNGNGNGNGSRVRVTVGGRSFVTTVPAGSYAAYRRQGRA